MSPYVVLVPPIRARSINKYMKKHSGSITGFSAVQEKEFMMGSMAAGNPVPVFANMDFWTQAVEQHPEFFARVGRLQDAVRSIVDPAYEGLDGGQQMQMNMLMLTAIGVAEIVTL